jgi:hypothetical protein
MTITFAQGHGRLTILTALRISGPNKGLEGSAQELRSWVPSSLRSSAPPQPRRWAAC